MAYDFSISGEANLNARLDKLSEAAFFDRLLAETAQALFDQVEIGVQKHTKPNGLGMLERSIGSGPESIGNRTYVVKSDGQQAPYNVFVHFGSRPHDIRPKDRKALRWVSGSSFVFSKFVRHPGYKGDPFMVTAVDNVLRDFDSMVSKHLGAI